jgi:hypothetical protein
MYRPIACWRNHMPQALNPETTLLDTFYKKLTVAELKTLGFEFFFDRKDPSTTLRSRSPFLWSYPNVLEECLYKEQLLDALEQCNFDGDYFTVIAHGVLDDTDIFPFAIFQINATEKPIDLSAPAVREMVVHEDIRQKFENSVFSVRFIGSIERVGKANQLSLQSVGCPTKDDLLSRSQDGMDYEDQTVSAMWYGFKLALRQHPAPRQLVPLTTQVGIPAGAASKLSSLARAVLYHMLEGAAFRVGTNLHRFCPTFELARSGFEPFMTFADLDDNDEEQHVSIEPRNRGEALRLVAEYQIKDGRTELLYDEFGLRSVLPPFARPGTDAAPATLELSSSR